METYSIAFCDDDPVFRALLRRTAEEAFRQNGVLPESCEVSSGEELASVLAHRSFQVIFLDIDMPGTDGIRFGEQLRAQGCRADIIYVSNMDDKVYEIFHVHPWSFVRKSRFAGELPTVIGEYVRTRSARTEKLLLTGEEGQTVPVDPAEILYAEAVGKSQKLVLTGETTVLVRTSLRDLETRLDPYGFIRIHKGFLVNYRAIRKITSRSVLLDSGSALPIGRDRLSSARERYLALMKWKGLGGPLNG